MRRAGLFLTLLIATASPADAITLDTLLSFNGVNGNSPIAGLTLDATGNLYGTTQGGGASNRGTVFRLSDNGAGGYAHTTLFSFSGANGAYPIARLTLDAAGNLYGTTHEGGASNRGTVFRLSGDGSGGYSHTTLFSFSTVNGAYPAAGLTYDAQGNLYGTTQFGGDSGQGTVFRLSDNGAGGYAHTTLFSFNGSNGGNPLANVSIDAAGNLYGTTGNSAGGYGTVFRLSDNGVGGYTHSTLLSFNAANGLAPASSLTLDGMGNLYGTTQYGVGAQGRGTVYRLSDDGAGGYAHTTLLSFNPADGGYLTAGVILDASGNLYGATLQGGASNLGSVFRLSDNGAGGYTSTTLYSFAGNDGRNPMGDLLVDSVGNLYGTTAAGGIDHSGTVFRLSGTGFVLPAQSENIPEPSSLALLALASLTLATFGGRRGLGLRARLKTLIPEACGAARFPLPHRS
jgi:uncharacterized repeat protein (TIGR03803 family)